MGNILVLLNLHGCDLQEATSQYITKTLVNKPKQELQRDYEWTKVSSDMKNTTTYKKLTSDNGKRTIFLIKICELSKHSSRSLKITKLKKENAYMRTKSKLTLTHLITEKRNIDEIQILKITIKILHSSCKSFIKLT